MLRLTDEQRVLLAEKVADLANIGAGALVFGQFLAEKASIALGWAGAVLWFVLVAIAALLRRIQ